ncbi:magnesium transport protein transmembrane region, partial [Colletotrichum tofieldiae]
LRLRVQGTTQLLGNTLSFREQFATKSQNDSMLHLNKSAVFITTLTLLYLPSSFVATFFGMNFFDLNQEGTRIIGTSMIWIYVVSSAALTIATFLLYRLLLDGTFLKGFGHNLLLSRLSAKGSKRARDVELQSLDP